KKGAEFTRELLRENDKLRTRIVQLEDELTNSGHPSPSQQTLDELLARLHALEEERRQLLERFSTAEAAGERFSGRFEQIERENNDLASLFVAQTQLHATLDASEVIQVVMEILLNFVGAQRFAVLLSDRAGVLRVFTTEGIDPDTLAPVEPGVGVIGAVLAGGAPHIDAGAATERREPGHREPTVCFPLAVGTRVIGAVAIWCFLAQKRTLEELDRRIFELLWTGGGRALEAARLAGRERDLEPTATDPGFYEEYRSLLG
ncbi:MAG TPA: GAF domain-containing protein, partial [Kofleriaceae bacterium]|nr:GAF domain-containing protein [Kofleriaceae bacterium]